MVNCIKFNRFNLLASTLLFCGASLQAQDSHSINISGTVTGSGGLPMAGVEVRLAVAGISVTTDNQGKYTLVANVSNTLFNHDARSFLQGAARLNGDMLHLAIASDNVPVSVSLFDCHGRLVQQVTRQSFSRGAHAIALTTGSHASQMGLLAVRIGAQEHILRYSSMGGRMISAQATTGGHTGERDFRSARIEAIDDTVLASMEGFTTEKAPITGYSGQYDFTLEQPTPEWNGDTVAFWGDMTNIPRANNVLIYKFLNRTNGKYRDDQVFWSFNGQVHSIAERPTFDMPANSSGRMYFHIGQSNSEYNDFIEHTISPDTWYGNTTRVDAYGLPLAIRLVCEDGFDEVLGDDYRLFFQDRTDFFNEFKNEVPPEFVHLAERQAPYRIICPGAGEFNNNGQYKNYFQDYINEVWSIHNFSISRPNSENVFRCSGPIATEAAISAAINRHVAHLPQSEWRSVEKYYKQGPANYYSKFLHEHSMHKRTYGFPYDDYAEQAAYTAHKNPRFLLIAIGF